MSLSPELQERTLAKLRERFRGLYPLDRIILFVDERAVQRGPRTTVALIPPTSDWYELLPPEQIAVIHEPEGSN